MTRAQLAFVVWASIQGFFISTFSLILFRATQIHRIVTRMEKRLLELTKRVDQILA